MDQLSKKVLLLINPVAGRKTVQPHVAQIIRCLMDGGYLVTTYVTAGRDEAKEVVSRCAGDYDLLVCAGGDGTLNECVSGLAEAGLQVPVGYIPCGSTNDFAASHGVSTDIPLQAARIARGERKRYDVGCLDERCFLHHALFGAFTWMAYSTDQEQKNKLGFGAYVLDGVRGLSKLKSYAIKLTADSVQLEDEVIFGVVSTNRNIAGIYELSDEIVRDDDGKLAVVLIRAPKNMMELDALAHGILIGDPQCSMVKIFSAKELTVECREGIEWSLDGESSGARSTVHFSAKQAFLILQG